MKKIFIIVSLVLAMSLLIGLAPRDAKAFTLPQVLYSDLGLAYVNYTDLGVFGVSEWALMLHNYSDFSGGWGLGFMFYNPVYAEFGYIALSDDSWYMRGGGGNWFGSSGTCYSGASSGGLWTENFSTTPMAASEAAGSADLAR